MSLLLEALGKTRVKDDEVMHRIRAYVIVTGPKADIVSVNLPDEARAGETVRGTVTVKNVGDAQGLIWVRIWYEDPATGEPVVLVDSDFGPLAPGSQIPINFSFTMPNADVTVVIEAGHYKEEEGQKVYLGPTPSPIVRGSPTAEGEFEEFAIPILVRD
ncbi:MAG: hypothetical protein ACTSVD_06790 [Candidatus Thorarchaeota archaeon]